MRSIFISLSRCAPVPFDFAFGIAQEDKEMGFPFSALLRETVWKLIYFEEFGDIKYAIAREKQLKGWVLVKKENLINSVNPSWSELSPI